MLAYRPKAQSYTIGLDTTEAPKNTHLAILMAHPAERARLPNAQNKGQEVGVVGSESRGGIEGMYQGEAETMGGGNFTLRAGVGMAPYCPRDGALRSHGIKLVGSHSPNMKEFLPPIVFDPRSG